MVEQEASVEKSKMYSDAPIKVANRFNSEAYSDAILKIILNENYNEPRINADERRFVNQASACICG